MSPEEGHPKRGCRPGSPGAATGARRPEQPEARGSGQQGRSWAVCLERSGGTEQSGSRTLPALAFCRRPKRRGGGSSGGSVKRPGCGPEEEEQAPKERGQPPTEPGVRTPQKEGACAPGECFVSPTSPLFLAIYSHLENNCFGSEAIFHHSSPANQKSPTL